MNFHVKHAFITIYQTPHCRRRIPRCQASSTYGQVTSRLMPIGVVLTRGGALNGQVLTDPLLIMNFNSTDFLRRAF